MKIPTITLERMKELLTRVKPLMEVKGKMYWQKLPEDGLTMKYLAKTAYTWEPIVGELADVEPMPYACDVKKILILVSWGYYGFFKPSIAEVLSQIKDDDLIDVVGWTLQGPEDRKDMFDGGLTQVILNEGFQVATATLYRAKK